MLSRRGSGCPITIVRTAAIGALQLDRPTSGGWPHLPHSGHSQASPRRLEAAFNGTPT